MKLFANLLVVSFAASLTGVSMAAPKKGADAANECFVCKVNDETVEIKGKTCFTNKEKKKANKDCTKQKGKWVHDTTAASATGTEEAAPMDEAPME